MSLGVLYSANEWLIALGLLALLLLAGEAGFRLGRNRRASVDETTKSQISSLQAAILALFGLLLAFTISMAVARYDTRRSLVVQEANAIGTAYLRAQMLPEPHRTEISALLRQYVDVRLDFYNAREDATRIAQANGATERLQQQLWSEAVAVGNLDTRAVTTGLFVQALNDVIDLSATRLAALQNHVPDTVLCLLLTGAVVAMVLVGYGFGLGSRRSEALLAAFAILVTLVIMVIIDLDRPRHGLIQISQDSMLNLRDSLNQPSSRNPQPLSGPDRRGGSQALLPGSRSAFARLRPWPRSPAILSVLPGGTKVALMPSLDRQIRAVSGGSADPQRAPSDAALPSSESLPRGHRPGGCAADSGQPCRRLLRLPAALLAAHISVR